MHKLICPTCKEFIIFDPDSFEKYSSIYKITCAECQENWEVYASEYKLQKPLKKAV